MGYWIVYAGMGRGSIGLEYEILHVSTCSTRLNPNKNSTLLAAFFRTIGLADELGSGVRKMFKYGKAFAGADPTLMEDDLFHSEFSLESTIFNDIGISGAPINDAIRAPENETINETINESIKNSPGISLLGLVARTKKSRATVARTIAKLRSEGKVEYRGSKKTGGYYLISL